MAEPRVIYDPFGNCQNGDVRHCPTVVIALVAILVSAGSTACASRPTAKGNRTLVHVQLPSGTTDVDVYAPAYGQAAAPMVIIAHGFSRSRHQMSGWGEHLAAEGILTVVPDLPSWADHTRNGRFLSELRTFLLADESWKTHIDPKRIGLLGFSAGGLSSLLSAAQAPDLTIWVGLDPVDRDGLGVTAATMIKADAVVLTAEPSSWNANGNAAAIISALPRCAHFKIAGAVHVDAEWPTSWLAERLCGRSTEEKRREFQTRATEALTRAFGLPSSNTRESEDPL